MGSGCFLGLFNFLFLSFYFGDDGDNIGIVTMIKVIWEFVKGLSEAGYPGCKDLQDCYLQMI